MHIVIIAQRAEMSTGSVRRIKHPIGANRVLAVPAAVASSRGPGSRIGSAPAAQRLTIAYLCTIILMRDTVFRTTAHRCLCQPEADRRPLSCAASCGWGRAGGSDRSYADDF